MGVTAPSVSMVGENSRCNYSGRKMQIYIYVIIGASLCEPQFSDAVGKFCVCIRMYILHDQYTANALAYLFQQHACDAKVISR